MKPTKILAAIACSFFLSATAFAQTSPTGGTTTGSMSGSVNTQPQRGSGINKDGVVEPGAKGSMNGNTDRKDKMNNRKGTKKNKSSTTTGSTGTM